jgi:predicted transposase YdaD
MPTVYITNRSGHDFSPAEKFGKIKFLSEGKTDPFQVAKMYREFYDVLKDSHYDDYLMITALPVMNCVASAIMTHLHGRVNWLQYHAQSNSYKARTIVLDELLKTQEEMWQTQPIEE